MSNDHDDTPDEDDNLLGVAGCACFLLPGPAGVLAFGIGLLTLEFMQAVGLAIVVFFLSVIVAGVVISLLAGSEQEQERN